MSKKYTIYSAAFKAKVAAAAKQDKTLCQFATPFKVYPLAYPNENRNFSTMPKPSFKMDTSKKPTIPMFKNFIYSTSVANREHQKFPYLLRGVVPSFQITYGQRTFLTSV